MPKSLHYTVVKIGKGTVQVTMTNKVACLVSNALEIINPDSDSQEQLARDLALEIQRATV